MPRRQSHRSRLIRWGGLFTPGRYLCLRANSIFVPAWVLPEDAFLGGNFIDANDSDFALDPRLTRLGLVVNAGDIGDAEVTGRLEIDFANFPAGVPESRATPRMRLAYIDLDWGEWALRVGQDKDTYSPLYPAVNDELMMWYAGNLGDRRPQIRGTWKPESAGPVDFDVQAALGLTGAIDNADLDGGVGSERDGFDSGLPQVQLRLGFGFDSPVREEKTQLGLWGMIGTLETDIALSGDTHFTTWTVGTDLILPLTQDLTLWGEAWVGETLADARGGIAQSLNTTTGGTIGAYGGWGEFRYQASDQVRLHAGASMDNPDDADLTLGTAPPGRGLRGLNQTAYVGTLVDWGGGLLSGLDVLYWKTDWIDEGPGDMVRFDLYLQLNF